MQSNPSVTIERGRGPRGLEVLSALPADPRPERPPLLFVHGLGHGGWCWEHWLRGAAEAGYAAHAVSLRGHGGSEGRLRTARLSHYVDDVIHTAASLPRRPVLVGHSMGGLVVQQTVARYAAHAAVLVAPVPAHPAAGSLVSVALQHPLDAVRLLVTPHVKATTMLWLFAPLLLLPLASPMPSPRKPVSAPTGPRNRNWKSMSPSACSRSCLARSGCASTIPPPKS